MSSIKEDFSNVKMDIIFERLSELGELDLPPTQEIPVVIDGTDSSSLNIWSIINSIPPNTSVNLLEALGQTESGTILRGLKSVGSKVSYISSVINLWSNVFPDDDDLSANLPKETRGLYLHVWFLQQLIELTPIGAITPDLIEIVNRIFWPTGRTLPENMISLVDETDFSEDNLIETILSDKLNGSNNFEDAIIKYRNQVIYAINDANSTDIEIMGTNGLYNISRDTDYLYEQSFTDQQRRLVDESVLDMRYRGVLAELDIFENGLDGIDRHLSGAPYRYNLNHIYGENNAEEFNIIDRLDRMNRYYFQNATERGDFLSFISSEITPMRGKEGNDILLALAENNNYFDTEAYLIGGQGDDILIGVNRAISTYISSAHIDYADYSRDGGTQAIEADFSQTRDIYLATVKDTYGDIDGLLYIDHLIGTSKDDLIYSGLSGVHFDGGEQLTTDVLDYSNSDFGALTIHLRIRWDTVTVR